MTARGECCSEIGEVLRRRDHIGVETLIKKQQSQPVDLFRRGDSLLDVCKRSFQSFTQRNPRVPTEQRLRLRYVWLSLARIVGRQAQVREFRPRTGDADSFFRQLFDRELAGITEIDRIV